MQQIERDWRKTHIRQEEPAIEEDDCVWRNRFLNIFLLDKIRDFWNRLDSSSNSFVTVVSPVAGKYCFHSLLLLFFRLFWVFFSRLTRCCLIFCTEPSNLLPLTWSYTSIVRSLGLIFAFHFLVSSVLSPSHPHPHPLLHQTTIIDSAKTGCQSEEKRTDEEEEGARGRRGGRRRRRRRRKTTKNFEIDR